MGVSEKPKPGPLTSATLFLKVLLVPQPLTISWVWKPSIGELTPVLPSMIQLLPFTSTHESAPEDTSEEPSKWLFLSTPPWVPSLMSTDSPVVP
jgi:hypothetical protein